MKPFEVDLVPFEEHYICWEMPLDTYIRSPKFATYSKDDAREWSSSFSFRSYDTHSYNKYRVNPCDDMCKCEGI